MFLERIVTQTRIDLEQRKHECSLEQIRQRAAQQPPPRDLLAAFEPRSAVHLIAEVKRASPSKGMLAPHLDPVELARCYEANGATAISVLTEPHFFLGSLAYLAAIKQAVSVPVLRKDFIVDEYQVYEARAWGADAILLICALLDDDQLRHLLHIAHEQNMRCLVEVHSRQEAQRAIDAGAMIIGINSRDLVTFQMNPYLIREIRPMIPANRVVIAESGIGTASDARRLARSDVQGMLVGEALVTAHDVASHMQTLLYAANCAPHVKICGLRTAEHIHAAIDAEADMLGLVFYKPSHRYIEPCHVRSLLEAGETFTKLHEGQVVPDLVGVFVNEDATFINNVAEQAGLQFIQLHGTETPEFCQQIKRPVIKALHLRNKDDLEQVKRYKQIVWRLLLDTPASAWGGTGVPHDWELARQVAEETLILLAGGLTPTNVGEALRQVHPWGVDVSSGVETNKHKVTDKIRAFIHAVRANGLMYQPTND